MNMADITTATPVEIDTELADLHVSWMRAKTLEQSRINRILDYSGLRKYVTTKRSGRSVYQVTGTLEQGVEILRTHAAAMDAWREAGYPQGQIPKSPGNCGGGVDVDGTLADIAAQRALIKTIRADIAARDEEYDRRGGWARMYTVISSAGHIHSSVACHTRRPTTVFGWTPQLSGMTEAEAIAELGDYAESLCSVCYPTAPVNSTRKHITKAKAEKLSAGEFVEE